MNDIDGIGEHARRMVAEREAKEKETDCPGCRTTNNVELLNYGWLFRCKTCGWEWGHPQLMNREEAAAALHDARNP